MIRDITLNIWVNPDYENTIDGQNAIVSVDGFDDTWLGDLSLRLKDVFSNVWDINKSFIHISEKECDES